MGSKQGFEPPQPCNTCNVKGTLSLGLHMNPLNIAHIYINNVFLYTFEQPYI